HRVRAFACTRTAAEEARARVGAAAIIRTFEFAGLLVRVVLCGQPLLSIMLSAVSHAESSREPAADRAATPDLTIVAWDGRATGVGLPAAFCTEADIGVRGEIASLSDERFQAAYFTQARLLCHYDAERRYALLGVVDATRLAAFERTNPFRAILGWFLRRHGRMLVHAAAVATPDGAVVFGGRSGVGKSTTALRCLLAGLDYLGDDICCLSCDPADGPFVHGVFSSGKTHRRDWAMLPELEQFAEPRHHAADKEHYFLARRFAAQLPLSRPVRAVVIPDHSTGRIGFEPVAAAEAIAPIAASTTALLTSAGGEILAGLGAIVRRVPCYRFHLGPDPALIPAAVAEFIAARAADASRRAA
ncbi:MAG: hypothetical protein WCJ18_07595, partial [Planctomycetota bacterium]